MKIKRIFSAGFILMVLLSSTGYGSQNDFTVNPLRGQVPTGTVLIEHSENSLPEFRQTIKVSLSAITKTRSFSELHDAIQRAFTVTRHAQFNCYQQNCLSLKPSASLYLDFRVLLI